MIYRAFHAGSALSLALLLISSPPAHGASGIEGTIVSSADAAPVPLASVRVIGTNRGAISDYAGHYQIHNLGEGVYPVEVSHIGYSTIIRELVVSDGATVQMDFSLDHLSHMLGGVTITSLRPDLEPDLRLDQARVREANPRDLGEVLRDVPGLDAIRRGALGIDPTVRGLRETEVGTYIDGTRSFASCPGRMDSPLTHFDPSALRTIEVITGPYALTWGAGNMSAIRAGSQALPPAIPGLLRGQIGGGYDSNMNAYESYASIFGIRKRTSYLLSGSWRGGDDYQDGNGSDVFAHFRSSEIRGKVDYALNARSHLTFATGYQDQRDIDYPGRPMDAVFLKALHLKGEWSYRKGTGTLRSASSSVYLNSTDHEMNNDNKPSATANPPKDARTGSNIQTIGGRTAMELSLNGDASLEAGIDLYSALREAQRVIRRRDTGMILFDDSVWPDARITDGGFFIALREPLGPMTTSTSMRIDFVDATADTVSEFFQENASANLDQREINLSGALSASMPVGDHWIVSAGAGSVVRTADALERYADRFPSTKAQNRSEMLGDPEIKPERSNQADLWLRAHYPYLTARINGFYRVIDDYITMEATDLPRHLPGSPEPVYAYINGDARFYGVDGSFDLPLTRYMELKVGGAWLWAEDREMNEPVLGISPYKLDTGLRFKEPDRSRFFVEAILHHVGGQTRVAVTRGETPTDGYNSVDLKGGWIDAAGMELRGGVLNLTDKFYVNHLNGTNPFTGEQLAEPGRIFFVEAIYSF